MNCSTNQKRVEQLEVEVHSTLSNSNFLLIRTKFSGPLKISKQYSSTIQISVIRTFC